MLSRGLRVVLGVGRSGGMMAVLFVDLWTIGRTSVQTRGQIKTGGREAIQTQLGVEGVLEVVASILVGVVGNMVVGVMEMFMQMLPAIP